MSLKKLKEEIKTMDEEEIEELFEKTGKVMVRFYVEGQGPTVSALDDAMGEIDKLFEDEEGILVIKKKHVPAVEVYDENRNVMSYSKFIEFEFIAMDLQSLIRATVKYLPAAVEIIKPKDICLGMGDLQSTLLDITDTINAFNTQLLYADAQLKQLQSIISNDKS